MAIGGNVDQRPYGKARKSPRGPMPGLNITMDVPRVRRCRWCGQLRRHDRDDGYCSESCKKIGLREKKRIAGGDYE